MSDDRITLAHGEGSWLSHQLIERVILPRLRNPVIAGLNDAAALVSTSHRLAFTTDSFVVTPLFFPGGDIGRLAVFGTVNDLAVSGARPRWLSLSFILEEELEISILERVLDSIAEAANSVSVHIVAGDTKVVPRGAADRMFITTSGIGELFEPVPPGPQAIQPGDALLISGHIGRHGIAILNARENLGFEPPPLSDCASLRPLTESLRQANVNIRAMRDATRGGVAAVLHEWAAACGHTLCVDESLLPVDDMVRGAAELLGLDPIHIANEGTMLIVVPPSDELLALEALRRCASAKAATRIGEVRMTLGTPVTIRRGVGRPQPLDLPSGSQMPRIC